MLKFQACILYFTLYTSYVIVSPGSSSQHFDGPSVIMWSRQCKGDLACQSLQNRIQNYTFLFPGNKSTYLYIEMINMCNSTKAAMLFIIKLTELNPWGAIMPV